MIKSTHYKRKALIWILHHMLINNTNVLSISSLCPLIYGHLVSLFLFIYFNSAFKMIPIEKDMSSMYQKDSPPLTHFFSSLFVVSESSSGFGIVWRQAKTHRQQQHSSKGGPTHPDRWRPWTGKEPDVTGST